MSALEIKNLGVVNKFFGLRISLDEEAGYVLDQEVSIDLLSKEYGLETANGVRASIVGNASVKNFQSLMGRLLWMVRCTRPDVCFAVQRLTRQTHNPTMDGWEMAERISKYLKETKMIKLQIGIVW